MLNYLHLHFTTIFQYLQCQDFVENPVGTTNAANCRKPAYETDRIIAFTTESSKKRKRLLCIEQARDLDEGFSSTAPIDLADHQSDDGDDTAVRSPDVRPKRSKLIEASLELELQGAGKKKAVPFRGKKNAVQQKVDTSGSDDDISKSEEADSPDEDPAFWNKTLADSMQALRESAGAPSSSSLKNKPPPPPKKKRPAAPGDRRKKK